MAVDPVHPPLTYLKNPGGSPFVAADRSTNRLWRGLPCSAVLSGLTIPGNCITDADGFRWKMQSTTAPNGTFCAGLLGFGGACSLIGANSGPSIPDLGQYTVPGCPGSPSQLCRFGIGFEWFAFMGVWIFDITCGICDNGFQPARGRSTFAMFTGMSSEKCFPMTINNLQTSEGPTTAGALGLPSSGFPPSTQYVALGTGGSVTITVDDCHCP